MSLSEIYFNYNKAMEQADELDDVAGRLAGAADRDMENILSEVGSAWRSDSSAQYLQKGRKVKGDLHTTAGNLRNIASAIRTIARRIRDAELEAWRIANERRN